MAGEWYEQINDMQYHNSLSMKYDFIYFVIFILLLQHEPTDLEELDEYGIDLAVSGHTHDGQIFPGNIVSRIKGPQSYGLKKWGDADVIVTSGVGYYGPPIRVATISEIVVIDFK